MLSAIDWELHARQTRGLAERLERFGDPALSRRLAAAADLLERRSAILRSSVQGTAEIHILSAVRRRRRRSGDCLAGRDKTPAVVMPLVAR
jgi:hypothetical protein